MGSRKKVRPTPVPSGPALLEPTVGVLVLALGGGAVLGCQKNKAPMREPDPPMAEPMPPMVEPPMDEPPPVDAPMPDPGDGSEPSPPMPAPGDEPTPEPS